MSDAFATIPLNPNMRIGELDCGLSYYVLHNPKPANRIELRLVVRVGSMNEQEHERGLAHFVEHMGFKGTRSYEQYQLVRFLESLGIAYGPELNASTHLHETCFNLRVNSDEQLENLCTGLKILEEWAYYMTISEADVQSERSIIQAEWRSKQGAGQRMLDTYWKRVLGDNLYAERMPIGLPEVFMHCEASLLRDFYLKWYTPDRMSVVVVGDFAGKEDDVVSMIQSMFAMPERTHAPPRAVTPAFDLPSHSEDVVVALKDPELTNASITFESMFRLDPTPTKDHMKHEVIRRMLTTLFDRRFHTLSKGDAFHTPDLAQHAVDVGEVLIPAETNPPFLSAGISIRPVVRNLMCLGVTVQFARGQQAMTQALNAVCQELRRACEFGFTPSEIDGAKLRWMEFFEELRDNAANMQSSSYASEIVQYILHDQRTVLADPKEEAAFALELLQDISVDDVALWVNKLDFHLTSSASGVYTGGHQNSFRVISGQFPGNEFTDDQLLEAIDVARCYAMQEPLTQWPDSGPLATLLESNVLGSDLKPGVIVATRQYPNIDATEYQLSNGICVCCKWMPDAARGQVSMQGFALGGSTELSEEEEAMMSCLDDICTRSGLAGVNGRNYSEIQSRYKTRVNTQRHYHHRGIGGSSPTKRFELLLQMLHLKLTAQTFDPVAFHRCIKQQRDAVEFRDNAPEFNFMERARVLTVGDVPIMRVVTNEVFDRLSLEMAKDLYTRAFMLDPTEFTFVFVGDLPPRETLESLLQQYVGSLQPMRASEEAIAFELQPWVPAERRPFSPLGAVFPSSSVTEHMDLRITDKSSVLLAFHAPFPLFSDEDDVVETATANLCCSVAQARLLEVLRIRFGHVYSVSVGLGRNSLSDFGLLSVTLHCDSDKSGEVCELITAEMRSLIEVGPSAQETKTAVEIMANSRTLAMENSSYWLFWVLDAFKAKKYAQVCGNVKEMEEICIDERVVARSTGFTELLARVTEESLRVGFGKYFDLERRVQLILGPIGKQGQSEDTPVDV